MSIFLKSVSLVPISNGLGMSPLLPSCDQGYSNWNVIPLLQIRTADTAHIGTFTTMTRPFLQFLGWDETNAP